MTARSRCQNGNLAYLSALCPSLLLLLVCAIDYIYTRPLCWFVLLQNGKPREGASMATQQITIDQLDKDQIKSFSDFLLSYNKLSELCFIDCVSEFTGRTVSDKEDKCALNCMEKFLKMNQRISQRFQEFQMLANENAIAAAQKLGGGK
uniref:Mitochondrial import inner membrane translocase subunit n=2 Tax=Anopheles merus TaxID=30066 RepID=A0A182URN0_ANOME